MAVRRILTLLGLSTFVAGCAQPPGGFDSPVPAQRLNAITEAAEREDEGAIPELIRMLSSDDPLVRMASIRSLERLTGQTLGYDHAAPSGERWQATRRWADWYRAREGLPPDGPETDSEPPPS
jgi:HEAT repeat protein